MFIIFVLLCFFVIFVQCDNITEPIITDANNETLMTEINYDTGPVFKNISTPDEVTFIPNSEMTIVETTLNISPKNENSEYWKPLISVVNENKDNGEATKMNAVQNSINMEIHDSSTTSYTNISNLDNSTKDVGWRVAVKELDPDITHIVEESDIAPGEYPYLVVIFGNSRALCNGVILTNDTVLTAATCLNPNIYLRRKSDLQIMAGVTYLDHDAPTAQWRGITDIINREGTITAGLVLLKLNEALLFDRKVTPARLAQTVFAANKKCAIIGWQFTSSNHLDTQLRDNVPIYNHEDCLRLFPGLIDLLDSSNICAPSKHTFRCVLNDASIAICGEYNEVTGLLIHGVNDCHQAKRAIMFVDVGVMYSNLKMMGSVDTRMSTHSQDFNMFSCQCSFIDISGFLTRNTCFYILRCLFFNYIFLLMHSN